MNYWKFSLVSIVGAVLAAASCSHPPISGTTSGSGGSGSSCTGSPGTLGCPCNGSSCDQGLSCATIGNNETQCVSTGSGNGGTTGNGGTNGSGGTTGSGGSGTGGTVAPGSGGSSSGGTNGTGGTTGSGGSATGGTPGTGGTTGTGGSSSGGNLIANGDFSQGMTNWAVPNGSPMNVSYNGQACMTLGSGSGTVILGWGGSSLSVNLMANVNYTLTFQVKSTGALSDFEVHVGSAVSVGGSYPIDYQVNPSPAPGNNLTSYTEMFSVTNADPQTGLAFQFAASTGSPTVCVANVSLTQN